jgi:hypothetical protein
VVSLLRRKPFKANSPSERHQNSSLTRAHPSKIARTRLPTPSTRLHRAPFPCLLHLLLPWVYRELLRRHPLTAVFAIGACHPRVRMHASNMSSQVNTAAHRVWRSPSPVENRDAIKLESTAATARSPIRRRRSSPRNDSFRANASASTNAHAPGRLRVDATTEIDVQLRALRAQRAQRLSAEGRHRSAASARSPPLPPAPELWPPVAESAATREELRRRHDRLSRDSREREALSGDTNGDSAEQRLRLARRLREQESLNASNRSHRSDNRPPTYLAAAGFAGYMNRRRQWNPYLPHEPTTASPEFLDGFEDEDTHVVDRPLGANWYSIQGTAPPILERNVERRTASPSSIPPAYTTWDYTHLRQGIERSASPPGAVRSTGAASSGPETAIAGDFPPLRRMSNRSVEPPARVPRAAPLPTSSLRESWSPASPVDGLGDRARSFSPDDNWDTMLSTIAPDTTLPSADSSFTSAAASASFSAPRSASGDSTSHSASSSRTHLTIPSRSEEWTCETDEEMEERDSRPSSRLRIRMVSSATRQYTGRTSNVSSAGARRAWRETSSEGTPDLPSAAELGNQLMSGVGERPTDPDLEQMRGILERLASRSPIPEELWLGAGLDPSLSRSFELFNRRRTDDGASRREERERL